MNALTTIRDFLHVLAKTLESILRVLIFSRPTQIASNKHPTQNSLAILGNGPSLNSQIQDNKEVLACQDLLCVNHFPTTEYFRELKPKYFVTAVPELWLEDVNDRYRIQRTALLESLISKTDWDLTVLVPHRALKNREWRESLQKNPAIRVVTINTTPIEGVRWFRHLCFRLNLGMPRPHNVLIPSLMVSIALGYQQIRLYGVDHSWLEQISVDEQNRVLINQKHYYDEQSSQAEPMTKLGRGKRNLAEVLRKFVLAFEGYFVIREYAEKRNVTILNCTKGSFIDAFERTLDKRSSVSLSRNEHQ